MPVSDKTPICLARCVWPIATVLALSSSAIARAAPPEVEDEAEVEGELSPEAEADWKRAEQLFRQGSARYSAADYAGAIEAFQAALELVALHGFERSVEHALLVNLARAHRRAFEVDKDITHLRTALEIYRRLDRVAVEGTEEHAEALTAMPELDAQIAAIEAASEPVEPPDKVPPDQPPPTETASPEQPGRGLLIGGGVALGLGAAGLGLMTFGLLSGQRAESDGLGLAEGSNWTQAEVDAIDQRGRRGNTLAIVGGVVGGLGVAAGATLVGLAIRQRRASATTQASVLPLPYAGPRGGGVTVEVRF